MESVKTTKEISDFYEKYFIEINVYDSTYYLVWGADLTDNGNDKVLLDSANKILLFKTTSEALHYSLNHLVVTFDAATTKEWATSCLEHGTYSSYVYDLNRLLNLIKNDQFLNMPDSNGDDYLYVINFINLIGDYAYQLDDQYLLAIHRGESIRRFFDYTYDNYFWIIPQNKLAIGRESVLSKFDCSTFKQDMLALFHYFKSHLVINFSVS